MTGTWDIPALTPSFTVSGLNLSESPQRVVASVRKPSGGATLCAIVEDGSISENGFTVHLAAGMAPTTGYKLDWFAAFES